MSGRYVVNEHAERVAVLLDVGQHERLLARHDAPVTNTHEPTKPSGAREKGHRNEQTSSEPPDAHYLDPEEAERRITAFVASADGLPGPPVADLADRIAGLMRATWRDVEAVVGGRAAQQGARRATPSEPESPGIAGGRRRTVAALCGHPAPERDGFGARWRRRRVAARRRSPSIAHRAARRTGGACW